MNFSLMNMYWNSVYTSSNINSLLEKEDTTLEDLLEQDDVVDECQRDNTALLQRLIEHENVSRMVDMMLSPPDPSLPDATKYKNAFKACEVLTCESALITKHLLDGLTINDDQLYIGTPNNVDVSDEQENDETEKKDCDKKDINVNEKEDDITKELSQEEVQLNHDEESDTPTTEVTPHNNEDPPVTDEPTDQPNTTDSTEHSNDQKPPPCPPLERLYNFLHQDPPLNPLQSSFFTKTMILLLSRYTRQTVSFLYSKADLIQLLISHIEVSSITDFLTHLWTSFNPSLPPSSWDFDDVIKKLLQRLDPSFSRQVHSNVSQCVCEILKVNREKILKLEDLKRKRKVIKVQGCDMSNDNNLENKSENDSSNTETTFKSVLNDNNAVNNNNNTLENNDEDNSNNSSTSDSDKNIITSEGIDKNALAQNLNELNIDDDGFNGIYLSNDEEKGDSYYENEEKEYAHRKNLVDVICSEAIVNILLELLQQHHNDSTIINTITILQGILSPDCHSLCAPLDTVLSRLQIFVDLLHNPPPSLVARESQPTLGSVRLSIIRFFNHLLSLDQTDDATSIFIPLTTPTPPSDFTTSVHHAFTQTQALPVIMDLFYKFPYNNFLHTEVSCLISHALEHPLKPHPLLKQLLSNCDFVQKTMDEISDNCYYNGKTNRTARRPGYIGHLCKIANQLTSHEVVQGGHYADLLSEGTRRDWEAFCSTTLASINRINDTPLCTSGNTRTSDEEEEEEGSGEVSSFDQNFFAEYCKQMSKDFQTQPVNTDFVENFSMTPSQLTPADKSTSDPLADTLSLINFDIDAILKRERPSACIFDRALNSQFPILLSTPSAFSNDTSLSKDDTADGDLNEEEEEEEEEKEDASITEDSDNKEEFDSDLSKKSSSLQNHSEVTTQTCNNPPETKTIDNDDDDYITITDRSDVYKDVKNNGMDVDGREDVETRKTTLSKQLSGTPVDCSE